MTCTRCGSDNISRSRRRGLADHLCASLGLWPYRCEECSLRFWADQRRRPRETSARATRASGQQVHSEQGGETGSTFRSFARKAAADAQAGPEMAFRTGEGKPQAKIVLQADSHEQLSHILLALNRAVMAYQPQAHTERETADMKR